MLVPFLRSACISKHISVLDGYIIILRLLLCYAQIGTPIRIYMPSAARKLQTNSLLFSSTAEQNYKLFIRLTSYILWSNISNELSFKNFFFTFYKIRMIGLSCLTLNYCNFTHSNIFFWGFANLREFYSWSESHGKARFLRNLFEPWVLKWWLKSVVTAPRAARTGLMGPEHAIPNFHSKFNYLNTGLTWFIEETNYFCADVIETP